MATKNGFQAGERGGLGKGRQESREKGGLGSGKATKGGDDANLGDRVLP